MEARAMPVRRAVPVAAPDLRMLFSAEPLERVALLRAGVPAHWIKSQLQRMGLSVGRFCEMCGMARATFDRKLSAGAHFEGGEAERVLGLLRLAGQVELMVQQSGASLAAFDAGRWLADWLDRPHPALGGRLPGDMLDTADGRGLVSTLLAQMQSGAYA